MNGYIANIENLTEANDDFRQVLYTGHHLQPVLMSLNVGQDIGFEIDFTRDQFFRIEQGQGNTVIDGETTSVTTGDRIVIAAGALHNLVNNGEEPMNVYTLYGQNKHIDHLPERTKPIAVAARSVFDGATTE